MSDRDTRFTGEPWRELCAMLRTKHRVPAVYHPQTGGQSERTDRTIAHLLRGTLLRDDEGWTRCYYRSNLHTTVRKTRELEATSFRAIIWLRATEANLSKASLTNSNSDRSLTIRANKKLCRARRESMKEQEFPGEERGPASETGKV